MTRSEDHALRQRHGGSSLQAAVRTHLESLLGVVELVGLVVIGLATSFAMVQEGWKIAGTGAVSITDLLVMFLYLEVLAMVARYLKLGQLPVRFPLYIAMVSLARDVILRYNEATELHLLALCGGIAMLACGVLILRYGQARFPSTDDGEAGSPD
ncbi:phosphate-starvation-inducible protein PsiE [Cupriavidus sp. 2TAF22]|uniref:phosphate-starvation-inducible protein PsiE n=1 Tax=unclassified Cupriavidus TaxID=2640874 RepID=UPI003F93AECE